MQLAVFISNFLYVEKNLILKDKQSVTCMYIYSIVVVV
jgi:hypothetical protein